MPKETVVTAVHRATADSVPADATVRHYDELPPSLKERFPALVAGAATGDSDAEGGTFVKFTEYYRLRCE